MRGNAVIAEDFRLPRLASGIHANVCQTSGLLLPCHCFGGIIKSQKRRAVEFFAVFALDFRLLAFGI